jgi:hypothetical protein
MTTGRQGSDGFAADLAREREHMKGRSAPYERALALLPDVLAGPPGRYVESAWSHRTFFAWWDRPLLLLAALRHDALVEGPGHPLHAAFAAREPRADAVTREALREALDGACDRVYDALAHRWVQTNETSRAVAWLWPAELAGLSHGRRPVALADVGASAGLNLVADLLPAIWTDETGAPLEIARGIGAVARLGLDPAPLDATREEDADWLRACIWPGDGERLERLEAALSAFRAARPRPDGPVLAAVAATAVPARLDLLSVADRGAVVLAYQTIMRDYLPPEERAEYEAGMRSWVASQPPAHALWVELEIAAEDDERDRTAAIVAHVRGVDGGVHDVPLARCGYHPTRVLRDAAGVRELRTRFAEAAPGAAHP